MTVQDTAHTLGKWLARIAVLALALFAGFCMNHVVNREQKIERWCKEHNGVLLKSSGPTECVKSIEYFEKTP